MALTATVSKSAVRKGGMEGLWHVSVMLAVTDDGPGDGFTRTFSTSHKLGGDFDKAQARLAKQLQKAVQEYVDDEYYFNHAKFGTLVTNLENGLDLEVQHG